MQCMSCTADIPPQWKAAISKNVCPSCDGPIMSTAEQELLTELKEAMLKMPNDPEGLAGWLLSNYELKKIGTAEPTEFFVKKTQKESKKAGLKIANNPVHDFLKRAGATKEIEQRNNFKQIVEEIQSGSIDNSLYGMEEEELINDEEEEIDQEDDAYQAAELARQNFQSQAKTKAKNSLVLSDGNTKPLTKADVADISESFGSDIDENALHPALQKARLLRLQKQQNLANGGGEGSFRRG